MVPVADKCGRANNEGRKMSRIWGSGGRKSSATLLVLARDNADGLETFAETHVCAKQSQMGLAMYGDVSTRLTITQTPMQLVLGQESHPIDTILLIRSEFSLDGYRDNIGLHLAIVKQL